MVGIQIYCCDMQVAVEWFVRETKAGDGHIFSVLCSKEYYYHLRKKKKKSGEFCYSVVYFQLEVVEFEIQLVPSSSCPILSYGNFPD